MDSLTQTLDADQVVCSVFISERHLISLVHVILLKLLCTLGFHDIELTWFTNYLSHRIQRVRHKDMMSSWSPVKGVEFHRAVHLAHYYSCIH